MEKDVTSGSVCKNILVFSLPYFCSYLLHCNLGATFDGLWGVDFG